MVEVVYTVLVEVGRNINKLMQSTLIAIVMNNTRTGWLEIVAQFFLFMV